MSATYVDLTSQAMSSSARPIASRTIADALSRFRRALPIELSALTIVPNVSTTVRQLEHEQLAIYATDSATFNARTTHVRLVSELGWTSEQAAAMRHELSAFVDDWNDPAMDAYDAL